MNDKELNEFLEIIYESVVNKLKQENFMKTSARMKNAKVVSVTSVSVDNATTTIGQDIEVKFPYDTTSITVKNKTGEELASGDTVQIMYWVDLKNAVAVFKV